MRTTLDLDDEVLEAVRAIARLERRPLGRVVSDLVRRGLVPQSARLDEEDGFPVFRIPPEAAPITEDLVQAALEEA